MEVILKILVFIAFLVLIGGCDIGVPRAYAPSDPPMADAPEFKLSQIVGTYRSADPKMFFWPAMKQNAQGEWVVPMSFDEKLAARQAIGASSDSMEIYQEQLDSLKAELNTKFAAKNLELEKLFGENQCYAYCDPEDFLCDPEDALVLFVDAWKVTEDPEELKAIEYCQSNQSERQGFEDEKKAELRPIEIKLSSAVESLLGAIGNNNYFSDLKNFVIVYNISLPENERLQIQLQYKDVVYTNNEGGGITNIEFDSLNGYLTFDLPGLQPNTAQIATDKFIRVDLEMKTMASGFKVDGDIKRIDKKSYVEELGRFSSSGKIVR